MSSAFLTDIILPALYFIIAIIGFLLYLVLILMSLYLLAILIDLANALKMDSIIWCSFSPVALYIHVTLCCIAERFKKVMNISARYFSDFFA